MTLHHRLIGHAAGLAYRIVRPRTIGVRAVLLDQWDRVALVRHTYTAGWYLPGGGVKKGEGTQAALFRELAEEIAVTAVTIERVLGVYHSRREGKDDHVVVYAVRTVAEPDAPLPRADPREVAEARWFPLDALPAETSPATARRVAEYRAGVTGGGAW